MAEKESFRSALSLTSRDSPRDPPMTKRTLLFPEIVSFSMCFASFYEEKDLPLFSNDTT